MPNHTLKTKLEIGFLSESDIEVDYYYHDANRVVSAFVDIEAVRVTVFAHAVGTSVKTILDLDLDYLDTSELEPLCLADAEKRQPAEEFDESRADEMRRGEI